MPVDTLPRDVLVALLAFLRARLAPAAAPLAASADGRPDPIDDGPVVMITAAVAPFATTSYARARLLRQLHASGLLTEPETRLAERALGAARC